MHHRTHAARRAVSAFYVAVALVIAAAPSSALAWGQEGHAIVAEIARQYLTPKALSAVDALLAADAADAGGLAHFREALRDPPNLRQARRDFEPFSTELADVARSRHVNHREGLHVFECPMAPVLGTGRWLARTTDLKNPFFGSAMLRCGTELN